MNWILPVILLIAVYAAIAYYIHSRKLWEDRITFYGPIMAIKTNRIGFFDKFIAFRTFFRIYGTAGVAAVIIVSVFITLMLFISCPAGAHRDLQTAKHTAPSRYQ
jgi:hypothetical protein